MHLRGAVRHRRRREPEKGVLHHVLTRNLEAFLARAHQSEPARALPRFAERELRRYIECGLLVFGFVRVHCASCLRDELVAFSCTSAVSFDPLTFIERLAALVPRPRSHQLTYHGILAPAAGWRDLVVPARPKRPGAAPLDSANPSERRDPHRSTWAELLGARLAIDVLVCPHCGGPRKLIALITQPEVVRVIIRSDCPPSLHDSPPRARLRNSSSPEKHRTVAHSRA